MSGSVTPAVETFDWLRPDALRDGAIDTSGWEALFRPAILEYATDDFIPAFLADLAAARGGAPAVLRGREVALGGATTPKLFQPLHGRFYLVVAALACRHPGFPDRCVRRACEETVFLVQRRRVNGAEFGWIAEGPSAGWQPASPGNLVEGEERIPLLPTPPGVDGRALWFAYLPVASRETFTPVAALDPNPETPPDERHEDFALAVIRPLSDLLATGTAPAAEVSFFLLHDLARFLEAQSRDVYRRLTGVPGVALTPPQHALVSYLEGIDVGGRTLAHWIGRAATSDYLRQYTPGLALPFEVNLRTASGLDPAALEVRVFAAGVLDPLSGTTPDAAPQRVGKFAPRDAARPEDETYVLRCVYERPRCAPVQRWISRPVGPYRLAEVMDPDAPARPVRISLPADVSIAGLRKFQKGVGFAMSRALRNKIAGIGGREKDLLDGKKPGADGSFDLGHVCSFALPIITLCAFILLLVIAVLLNLVFWWLPFLKICFPVRSSR
jgi:hypothetical protein